MESWRTVWRKGIAPQFSLPALEALVVALREDSPRLLQGATTSPPPMQCVRDWPVEAACAVGWGGAVDGGGFLGSPTPATVVDVEEWFAQACFTCDLALGEPAACRWFLNWADETPREEMRRELLPEVLLALSSRQEAS